jgi:hypothetical protein
MAEILARKAIFNAVHRVKVFLHHRIDSVIAFAVTGHPATCGCDGEDHQELFHICHFG